MTCKDSSMKYAASAHFSSASSYKKSSVLLPLSGTAAQFLALLVMVFCFSALPISAAASRRDADEAKPAKLHQYAGVISRVVDGDTFWLARPEGGKSLKVRMTGIDAPEICQPGGVDSRNALAGRVLGKDVVITVPKLRSRDDYGRVLATLELNGEDIGRWMVRSGQAWSYRYKKRGGPYASEQLFARGEQRGLFADSRAEEPRDFRKRNGSCYDFGNGKGNGYEAKKSVVLH